MLSPTMLAALDLLEANGPARRVRRGWCFSSMDRDIITPATMDALEARGLVAAPRGGVTRAITRTGRDARREQAGRVA